MVGYAPTMVVTGNGESGFDSGEGAWETAQLAQAVSAPMSAAAVFSQTRGGFSKHIPSRSQLW